MQTNNEYFAPVQVSQGMFSNEYAASMRLADNKEVSFFADKDLVVDRNGQTFLRAVLIKQKDGIVLLLLPVETFYSPNYTCRL